MIKLFKNFPWVWAFVWAAVIFTPGWLLAKVLIWGAVIAILGDTFSWVLFPGRKNAIKK